VPEARADLAIAEAERDKARYMLEQTKIYAPFAGTVLSKKAEAGGFIDRLHFNGYYAICELADLTKLEVDVSVDERDLHLVFPGQKCTVHPEAFPDALYEGRVARFSPVADRAKSAVSLRIRMNLSKPAPNLRPEMAAVVRFLGK
jgi:HlyD family secretion protein